MNKRNIVIVTLATLCLTVTMFSIIPVLSVRPYNPWVDVNDDGVIDAKDYQIVKSSIPAIGTPINKTALYANWYDGLVGYWKLDEGDGNMALDSSGNGNDGALLNNPIWVEGKYGRALNFSGDNYVEIADSESLCFQNFTLEAWIYMALRPYEQGDDCAIIHKFGTDAESTGCGYMFRFRYPNSTDDNLAISTGWAMAGERVLIQYNSINNLTLNSWHHIVGTLDGYTVTLYIDGVPRTCKTYSEAIQVLYWKSFPLLLGAYGFSGMIDNVMIYNRTLSTEEVMRHYVLPPS